ncbi:unnamed protein product [Pelagomonas calceolata]|uniref:MYND-type domain-containing protein n=1 Tax=Pelagomonas calceolata TaxID=35677 RepID=A0A8J2S941_9STRA|nr:unnamed protein product [Pelagomonas calceolata]
MAPSAYLLTNCAACAAPLAHDAPRCVRCRSRYCDATCQQDHWRRGHKQICKKIHRGGDAERYHANKKYKEAVAVAVEKCAEDAKGQTCYICTKGVFQRTNEGLVRMCACRGTAGFAHVSCLAEQAKILVAEAVENNLDDKVYQARWDRWSTCSLCEQEYRGVVAHALGWACWKTYCDNVFGRVALNRLATSMMKDERWEEGLLVHQSQLAKLRTEFPVNQEGVIDVLNNLKECYEKLGRTDAAIATSREIYCEKGQFYGNSHRSTLLAAGKLAADLVHHRHLHEAKELLSNLYDLQKVGDDVDEFHLKELYAMTLHDFHFYGYDDYREDLRKALEILEELVETSIRVHGEDHVMTESLWDLLWQVRDEQLDWSIDDLTPETRLAYHYDGKYEYSADSEEDADTAATTTSYISETSDFENA